MSAPVEEPVPRNMTVAGAVLVHLVQEIRSYAEHTRGLTGARRKVGLPGSAPEYARDILAALHKTFTLAIDLMFGTGLPRERIAELLEPISIPDHMLSDALMRLNNLRADGDARRRENDSAAAAYCADVILYLHEHLPDVERVAAKLLAEARLTNRLRGAALPGEADRAAESSLDSKDLVILRTLASRATPMLLADLAQATRLSPGTIKGRVGGMEESSHVYREPARGDKKKRGRRGVRITPLGRSALTEANTPHTHKGQLAAVA